MFNTVPDAEGLSSMPEKMVSVHFNVVSN